MADGMTDGPITTRTIEESSTTPAVSRSRGDAREAAGHRIRTPHAPRFRTAIAMLAGLAVVAIAVAIVAATHGRGSATAAAQWSPWSPSDGGTQGARDIADYVGPTYRASPADQLDVITVVNLESSAAASAAQQAQANGTTAPAQSGLQVAVRPTASSTQISLLNGSTVAYNLCGVGGKNCAIGTGKPSTSRLLLLRREALELALYTFKYIGGTQNVVAILPPGRSEQTASRLSKTPPTSDGSPSKPVDMAVLFVRAELSPFLKQPLDEIMPETETPTVSQMSAAPEAQLVSEVTSRGLFSEQLQQAQDGSSLILLDPLPAQ
jgi:hypothetical protein